MKLCRHVVSELGLPPAAINPLVTGSFASNLAAIEKNSYLAKGNEYNPIG